MQLLFLLLPQHLLVAAASHLMADADVSHIFYCSIPFLNLFAADVSVADAVFFLLHFIAPSLLFHFTAAALSRGSSSSHGSRERGARWRWQQRERGR